jgi:hypothetical protein
MIKTRPTLVSKLDMTIKIFIDGHRCDQMFELNKSDLNRLKSDISDGCYNNDIFKFATSMTKCNQITKLSKMN